MPGGPSFMPYPRSGATVAHPRAVRKLQAALSALPPGWRVLRNRRPAPGDGPPWVTFIALHPGKGIALIDILPADPAAAIAPLDEFLALTGYEAFSAGDPPIVAVALAADAVETVGERLAEAFATKPPCGIENAIWPEAAIELLMATPELFLARLGMAPDASAGEHLVTPVTIEHTEPALMRDALRAALAARNQAAIAAALETVAAPPSFLLPEPPTPPAAMATPNLPVVFVPKARTAPQPWAAAIASVMLLLAGALVFATPLDRAAAVTEAVTAPAPAERVPIRLADAKTSTPVETIAAPASAAAVKKPSPKAKPKRPAAVLDEKPIWLETPASHAARKVETRREEASLDTIKRPIRNYPATRYTGNPHY
jgi:hypothetical protein